MLSIEWIGVGLIGDLQCVAVLGSGFRLFMLPPFPSELFALCFQQWCCNPLFADFPKAHNHCLAMSMLLPSKPPTAHGQRRLIADVGPN